MDRLQSAVGRCFTICTLNFDVIPTVEGGGGLLKNRNKCFPNFLTVSLKEEGCFANERKMEPPSHHPSLLQKHTCTTPHHLVNLLPAFAHKRLHKWGESSFSVCLCECVCELSKWADGWMDVGWVEAGQQQQQ
ncbi:hypothetical protein INR49_013082 [Caranx melampygus]|nr:hypothetical protein INR49_013082 [Caranx melampygus]